MAECHRSRGFKINDTKKKYKRVGNSKRHRHDKKINKFCVDLKIQKKKLFLLVLCCGKMQMLEKELLWIMAEQNERNIMYNFFYVFTILMYGNASKNIPYNLFLVSYLTIHASLPCSFRLTNYVFQFHSFLFLSLFFLHFHLLILLYSLFCFGEFYANEMSVDVGVSDGCQVHCMLCNGKVRNRKHEYY